MSETAKAREVSEEPEEIRRELRRRVEEMDGLYRLLDDRERSIATLRRELAAIHATLGWRALERARALGTRAARIPILGAGYWALRRMIEILVEEDSKEVVLKAAHKLGLALRGRDFRVQVRRRVPRDVDEQYQLWLEDERTARPDKGAACVAGDRLDAGPVVSVIAVLDAADGALLRRAVETLRGQVYPRWELCVAASAAVWAALASEIGTIVPGEPRLRVVVADGGVASLANAFSVATGEFLGVLDPHDTLAPDALLHLVRCLEKNAAIDLVYSDEDAVDASDRRVNPFFKPEWSPTLLLSTNYLGRFALVRHRLVAMVGGPRRELGPGAAYDLWLRVTEVTDAIGRVAKVLYHRGPRTTSAAALDDWKRAVAMDRQAVTDALRRRGLEGDVEAIPVRFGAPPAFAPRLRLQGQPLVSIIIPTRDKRHLLEQTIRSVDERTSYGRYEVLVVDNESREPETLRFLEGLKAPCRVLRWPGHFNFSAINNFGAHHAEGEYLVFLNNDVEVLRPDWLTALLEQAQRPEVGAVGAKLLYPDGRIQHAGVVVGVGGLAVHAFRLRPGEPENGPRLADLIRECSAVTAACMMVPRRLFEQLGGFDEALRVIFQDVDLCLRIRDLGRLVVYTPFALLTHYEGASRGRWHPAREQKLFERRWRHILDAVDPYYSPNLTDTRDDWSPKL